MEYHRKQHNQISKAAQIQKMCDHLQKDWEKLAGEPVKVEFINTTYYGLCSELASLRILKAYRKVSKADCGYSENLKSHYFRLETE